MKKEILDMGGGYVSPAIEQINVMAEQVFAASFEARHDGFGYAYEEDDVVME